MKTLILFIILSTSVQGTWAQSRKELICDLKSQGMLLRDLSEINVTQLELEKYRIMDLRGRISEQEYVKEERKFLQWVNDKQFQLMLDVNYFDNCR